MRDYIILNGVNSNTITGLLISTLPPITKPKIRTQTEEIDGRDGDIITKLGYSAYDKEIEIGLYGDFDIDDVIAYFNSEGTVTFSNEPDKFYNYQILDQIDYEKLIRFKTAKVKMHVQPFKYPLEETPVEITNQYVNNEAEEMDLDNTKEAPMTIALKGNTYQEGTPTPDSPVDIQVVSGDNSIKIEGKNLFNAQIQAGTYNQATYTVASDGLITQSASDNSGWSAINRRFTLGAGTYTINCIGKGTEKRMQVRNITDNVDLLQTQRENATFTLNETKTLALKTWGDSAYPISYYIQIEKGTQATTYEPYQGASYPINLPEGIELCKKGDYQDYIYKDSGKWYKHSEIGKVVLNGSENWNNDSGTQGTDYRHNIYYASRMSIPIAIGTNNTYLSNYFTPRNTGSDSGVLGTFYMSNTWLVFVDKEKVYDLDQWKTWLGTSQPEIYYVLATPTTTEITDNDLIIQLEALKNASSYDTVTHITQNANDKPFILNATALKQGSGEATVNNEGNIYSKPTLDIEGSGTVGIYLEGNQMFTIDLSNSSECVIDTTQLEAYNPTTSELMNRQVTGDYSNFKLNAGDNQIQATGDITKVTISNYTRWL